MSLYTSLSGLNAAQASLSVTSNNIANAGTLGFRRSRAEFGDLFNSSPMAVASHQIGDGVQLARVSHLFSQGAIQQTGNALDLAINGQGFFAVAPQNSDGLTAFTRSGAFGIAADGVVRNSAGHALLFYPTAADGTSLGQRGTMASPLSVPGASGTARATSRLTLDLALPADPAARGGQTSTPPDRPFDPADPASFAFSRPVPLLGADGVQQEATLHLIRRSDPSEGDPTTRFSAVLVIDGQPVSADAEMVFDADGTLVSGDAPVFAAPGRSLSADLSGSRLGAGGFAIDSAAHDGATRGALVSLEVDTNGVLWSSYSNGDRRALGQVAMADFTNPASLRQIGNATYMATELSGDARFGSASAEGFGTLRSASLERSNVDLSAELVDLITAQRNYQASAKAMETASSILQTVMNIRG